MLDILTAHLRHARHPYTEKANGFFSGEPGAEMPCYDPPAPCPNMPLHPSSVINSIAVEAKTDLTLPRLMVDQKPVRTGRSQPIV